MYQEKWEALSARARNVLEILIGILTAGLTGFFLIGFSSNEGGMWGNFAAFAVALILPRIVEGMVGNKMPLMRRALLIGLAVVVVATLVLAIRAGSGA